MFSRTFQTIFFLQYFILFEFKTFLNFIFWQPVWSNRQPQYIVPNSLKSLETRKNRIYCVFDFIIWLFDLQSDILFLVFIFKKKCSKCKPQFLAKNLTKSLVLNGLCLVWSILDPKSTLSVLSIVSKSSAYLVCITKVDRWVKFGLRWENYKK